MTAPADRLREVRIQGVTPDGAGECAVCLDSIPDGHGAVAVLVGRLDRAPKGFDPPSARFELCLPCVDRLGLVGQVAAALARRGQKGTPSC